MHHLGVKVASVGNDSHRIVTNGIYQISRSSQALRWRPSPRSAAGELYRAAQGRVISAIGGFRTRKDKEYSLNNRYSQQSADMHHIETSCALNDSSHIQMFLIFCQRHFGNACRQRLTECCILRATRTSVIGYSAIYRTHPFLHMWPARIFHGGISLREP